MRRARRTASAAAAPPTIRLAALSTPLPMRLLDGLVDLIARGRNRRQ